MKIAIDLQACQNGSHSRGIGRYALSITRALVRNGRDRHTFRILLSDRFPSRAAAVREAFRDLLDPHEIVVVSVPEGVQSAQTDLSWRTRAAELVWFDAVSSSEPDAYFSPSLFEGFWDDAVTAIEPAPYLRAATIHDLIPLTDPDFYLAGDGNKRAYAKKVNALRRCDFLFSVSDFSKRDAVARLGVDPSKIFVMPLGVEEDFRPGEVSEERRQALLRKHRVNERFVINTSPFEARKNIPGLIAGFASVSPALRRGVQLVIAGKMNDQDRDEIQRITAVEGLAQGDVILPGFVPDDELIDLYRLCEMMVFPPFSEGFGLPPLEAMACGAAVLASSATSVPEVMGRQDALFDPTDPGDIGRAISNVLNDPSYRDELRAYGPQRAKSFSWDRSAKAILEVFESAHRAPRVALDLTNSPEAPVKLAVVAMSGEPGSRESALVKDYVRRLSSAFDVTVFQIDGNLGQDITIPLEKRNADDFIVHGGAFDRAIYILDSTRVAAALPIMATRPGGLLLYEPLAPFHLRELTASQIADLQQTGDLCAALERASDKVAWKRGAAAAALAHGVAVERDSALAGAGGVAIISARASPLERTAGLEFRRERRIPIDVDLWLAFPSDEEAAGRILQTFRANQDAAEKNVWLLLASAGESAREERLQGRVYVLPGGFTDHYLAAMSAASAVLVDEGLPLATQRRLRGDARSFALAELTDDQTIVGANLSPTPEAEPCGDRSGQSSAEDTAFLAIIDAILEATPPPLAVSTEVLRRLPNAAGQKRPEPQEVRDVADALAINAEHRQPGRILVDITTPLRDTISGTPTVIRRFLRALLAGGRPVRFVASDGSAFFIAGSFAGALLDLPALRDERFVPRANDVLVSLDLFDSEDAAGLTAAARVRRIYIEVADLVFERPDLSHLIAEAVLEAAQIHAAAGRGEAAPSTDDQIANGGGLKVRLSRATAVDASLSESVGTAAAALQKALLTPASRADSGLNTSFTVQGHVLGSYSLAIVNRRIARVLNDTYPGRVDFAPIETSPVSDLSRVPDEDRQLVRTLLAPARRAKVHATICQHYPIQPPIDRAGVGVALVAWEESHLPPTMTETLNGAFDGALAQVRTVQKALVDSGVWIPTVLTGLPADISGYQGACRRRGAAKTFLHLSSCFPRKGVDVLLEAWGRAFIARDGVKLVIKTFPNPHNDVQQQVMDLARRYPAHAPIEIVNRDMERDELIDLFHQADVMVLPTRGEGYNLPALEAMAAGLPLIVTGHGGHRDFCGPAEARLIDYEFALSRSHVREAVSYWAEPSVGDLTAALREQTQSDQQPIIEARRLRAIASARRAADPRQWSRTVAEFAQSLAGPVEHSPVRTSWVSTWAIRCGIAEYSRFLLEQASSEWREVIEVLADDRTDAKPELVGHRAAWGMGWKYSADRLLQDIDRTDPEAVVVQHQDGLIFWDGLAQLANDRRMRSRVTVVTLHTVRSLDVLPDGERAHVVEALRRFDRVLVHTVGDLNDLKRHGLIENVALFPHGALRPGVPAPPVRSIDRASAPVIGCHGFFFEHKRIDNLIRAAAKLKDQWPGLRLRLVNAQFPDPVSAGAIAKAKSIAAEVGMTGAIDWHTDFLPVEAIQGLLAGCDLLALPYDETGDSVSGAVRVAMSSQVPTLTTPVKIFSDLGDAVASVPTNEPDMLAEAIRGLLQSPERRVELQERMKAWLAIHDWKRMSDNLEGTIKAIAYARRREARQQG